MSRSRITIRIMWNSVEDEVEANKIMKIIESSLRDAGYRVSKSRKYKNRRGSGARVYINVR